MKIIGSLLVGLLRTANRTAAGAHAPAMTFFFHFFAAGANAPVAIFIVIDLIISVNMLLSGGKLMATDQAADHCTLTDALLHRMLLNILLFSANRAFKPMGSAVKAVGF